MTTQINRARGRPRLFDTEKALVVAQQLFWKRGYDAVSVSDITNALGITPPSFYSAFGSKTALFTQVLQQYSNTDGLPLGRLLRHDRPLTDCLGDLLDSAAHLYARQDGVGCLALEGLNSNEPEIRKLAQSNCVMAEAKVREYIADWNPDKADAITDFLGTTLSGLSTKARNGYDLSRLLACARLAKSAINEELRNT